MTEELEPLLKNLRLKWMAAIYDEQLRAAEEEQVSYSEFLTRLLRRSFTLGMKGRWSGAFGAPSCPRA